MNKTNYMVFYIDNEHDGFGTRSQYFEDMNKALAFMQELRKPERGITFVTMASESESNVGKMGVSAIVDGKCPDGTDFLGRTSRYGVALARGRDHV
jgi:hypothetical protein